MQPAPDRTPGQTEDVVLVPRPAHRGEVAALVARVRASLESGRRGRVEAARQRLASGALDHPDVFRAVARRMSGSSD